MKVTVSLGFRLLRRFERISLACGVSGVWAALFSDRGYVFWLCGPWGAWAGKYLVPSHMPPRRIFWSFHDLALCVVDGGWPVRG